VRAGMNVARVNLSHGEHAEHARRIAQVRETARRLGEPVAILADLPGPKFRVGELPEGGRRLEDGARVALALEPARTAPLPVRNPELLAALREGEPVYLADGAIELRVAHAAPGRVECEWWRAASCAPAPASTFPTPSSPRSFPPRRTGGTSSSRCRKGRLGRRVLRAGAPTTSRGCARCCRREPPLAHGEDREAPRARRARGDRGGVRRRDGGARRPRRRDRPRRDPAGAEAHHRGGQRRRAPGGHRHADARIDGRARASHARRSDRRGQRAARRHRRGDALGGNRRRALSRGRGAHPAARALGHRGRVRRAHGARAAALGARLGRRRGELRRRASSPRAWTRAPSSRR
jgi:hypothetical protein